MNFTFIHALVECLTLAILIINVCHCTSNENNVHLLYANRKEIKLLTVDLANSFNGPRVPTNITKLMVNLEDVPAIDFSFDENIIFWSDIDHEQIKSLRFNSTFKLVVTHVSSDVMSPDGLACDWVTKKIYWADSEMKKIQVVQYESKVRKLLYWSELDQPRGIALVPHRGLMFWTDWGDNPKIERSSMDGDHSARKVIIKENIYWPNGLTIDYDSESIYWADAKLTRLERANFDGENRFIVSSEHMRHPFAVTVGKEHLFWTDWVTKSVSMCNKTNGKARRDLFTEDSEHPMDIHVFSKERQPSFDSQCSYNNGGCSHLCLLSSTNPLGYSCACPTGIKLLEDGKNCASGAREILILARRTDLRFISLDTPDYTDMMIAFKAVKHSVAVDFDTTDGRIYWTDDESRAIRKGKLDGTSQEDVVVTDIVKPEGIAVDWISKNVYWIDAVSKTIEVARTNGSHRKFLIYESLHEPRAIAVHPFEGYIFWSDWGDQAKIERAALDGSMREVIVNTSIKWPNGIAIDFEYNYLYWCDAHYDVIEAVSLNGQNRRILTNEAPHPFGLSVFGNWFYWTDWQKRTVERANKITGESREIIVDQLPDVMGIKATANDSSYNEGYNSCYYNNGNCSHLCFYMPLNYIHTHSFSSDDLPPSIPRPRHVCSCANEFKLSADGFTCERDLNYVRPVARKHKEAKEPKHNPRKVLPNKACNVSII